MSRLLLSVAASLAVGIQWMGFSAAAIAAEPAGLPEGLVLKKPEMPKAAQGTLRTLNERLAKDLKPEDNAGVLLVQAFGEGAFDEDLGTDTLDMMGITKVSKTGPRFIFADEYVEKLGTIPEEQLRIESLRLQEKFLPASEKPWTQADYPTAAAFLDFNAKALELIIAASNKPRYYVPLITVDEPPRLLSASLAIERRIPFISRVLTARAMLRSASGDMAGAMDDLVACHKLARLLANGSPFDVSIAKAHLIDAIACRGEVALLETGKLAGKAAAEYQKRLAEIPPLPTAEIAADVGERAILRQELEFVKSDQNSVRSFFEPLDDEEFKKLEGKRLAAIDWEAVFAEADRIQDRVVKALATRDRKSQTEQFEALDADFAAWEKSADDVTKTLGETLDKDAKKGSRFIGESMAMSLRPLYRQRRLTDDRARVRRDMVEIGLALAIYRDKHGEYPSALTDLVNSGLLTSIPLDAHTDKPYEYKASEKNRAHLVSWGANTVDDAGKDFNDDQILQLQ